MVQTRPIIRFSSFRKASDACRSYQQTLAGAKRAAAYGEHRIELDNSIMVIMPIQTGTQIRYGRMGWGSTSSVFTVVNPGIASDAAARMRRICTWNGARWVKDTP